MPRAVALWLVLVLAAGAALGRQPPAELSRALPGAGLAGEAEVRWLGFTLYQAALYTPGGDRFDWGTPFALSLTYQRGLSHDRLLHATMAELTRLEGNRPDHPALRATLESCYRDVTPGDRFTALTEARDRVSLWFNGQRACMLEAERIRERFLGIWLSDAARLPSLSRQLRGVR